MMNSKFIIFLLICGSLFSLLHGKNNVVKQSKNGCQCYCSFKCGPRYPDQPGDAPFIDQETGICFCKERDRVHYFKHGCDKLNNAKNFDSCCDQFSNE